MQMMVYLMMGSYVVIVFVKGMIGSLVLLQVLGVDGDMIEFFDFCVINVENMVDVNGKLDVCGVVMISLLKEVFDEWFGLGVKMLKLMQFYNIGLLVQYKICGKDGQVCEFNNYMLFVDMNGECVFFVGVCVSLNDLFCYMWILVDSQDLIGEWMCLCVVFEDLVVCIEVVVCFVQCLLLGDVLLCGCLQDSVLKVLILFVVSDDSVGCGVDGQLVGGFQVVVIFIDCLVLKGEQEKVVSLLLWMFEGLMWEVWQIVCECVGELAVQQGIDMICFVQNVINVLFDSFLYGLLVYLQFDFFKQV